MAALNFTEIEEHAKSNGFDSCEFIMMTKNGGIFNGHFLDAYYGFVRIPELGDGFIRLDDIRKQYGFDFCSFIPLGQE
jgi:hypothetical protein